MPAELLGLLANISEIICQGTILRDTPPQNIATSPSRKRIVDAGGKDMLDNILSSTTEAWDNWVAELLLRCPVIPTKDTPVEVWPDLTQPDELEDA